MIIPKIGNRYQVRVSSVKEDNRSLENSIFRKILEIIKIFGKRARQNYLEDIIGSRDEA